MEINNVESNDCKLNGSPERCGLSERAMIDI